MKTILYQPTLYHIEKGDSFIEPANITGQLIINTLTDTEYEISWVKNNVMCSKQQEPDIDL